MTVSSCLYAGSVMHRRLKPKLHHFRYGAWWLLIDIDQLAETSDRLRLFAYNRFNLISLHDRDYGSGQTDLRSDVMARLSTAGVSGDVARIFLLTMPRLFGYVFNPLSVYLCVDGDDTVRALIYEVHNTFGERHSYVLPARTDSDGLVRQTTDKTFYVSPFMPMELTYRFRVRATENDIIVAIAGIGRQGPMIHASLTGRHRPLNDRQLLRAVLSHPLLTLKVVAAIHWEALRLWLKRLPLVPRRSSSPHPDRSQGPFHA